MDLLYILLVLLVVTRVFGEVAERLGQPVLVGELVSGILLGLLVGRFAGTFPTLAGIEHSEVFGAVTDLGMFFLMLLAGVELRPSQLARASRRAALIAVGGMLLPLALGLALGWIALPASDVRPAQTLFLGTCLAITAVPVSIKILMDLGRLKSELGQAVVAAALVDDVLSLVLLAVLTSVIESGSFPGALGVLALLGQVAGFFAAVYVVSRWILPHLGRLVKRLHADELEFSFLLVVALAYSVLAEALGMHFILGAFAAGLFFSRRTIDEQVYDDVLGRLNGISAGFLAPIFFASIGIHLELEALTEIPLFVLALVVVATIGKLVGAGVPAALLGFDRREALAVGTAMNARGAVELVIAGVALQAGLFSRPEPVPPLIANLFSAVVIMAVVTTLATPLALSRLLGTKRDDDDGDPDE